MKVLVRAGRMVNPGGETTVAAQKEKVMKKLERNQAMQTMRTPASPVRV